ncbi:Imm53 family immunity protein [Streptomyces sp. DT9]
MSDVEPLLDWLQNWYAQQCDGDWEHEWGVKIATLDNPGWTIEIDLKETDLEEREYTLQEVGRSAQGLGPYLDRREDLPRRVWSRKPHRGPHPVPDLGNNDRFLKRCYWAVPP